MYNEVICKDVVEANWIEFLKFVKERREAERKQQEELKEKYPNAYDKIGLSSVSNSVEGYYYGLDTSSFWQWYLDNKV